MHHLIRLAPLGTFPSRGRHCGGINKRTPRFYLDGEQRMEVLQYIV